MKHGRRIGPIVGVAFAVLGAVVARAGAAPSELTVSVAVSMKEVVDDLARRFEAAHGDVRVRLNLGASGQLEKQIEAGAPVDVFISAARADMDELERRGLVVSGTRRTFARNALVVVTPKAARIDVRTPTDLLDGRVARIVIGDPRTVPAGRYAEECLRALGLWDRVRPKLVFAENVRQALDYVSRGEVDAGFVYATDAVQARARVNPAFHPREDTYSPIVYPVAVMKESGAPALAREFVSRLLGADGQAALARFGFLAPLAEVR